MEIPPELRRVSRRARRDIGFLAAGVPPHLALAPLWIWGAAVVATTRNWLLLPAPFVLILLAVPLLTAVQRGRYRALLGTDIPRPRPVPERRSPVSAVRWLSSARTWCQVGYHLLLGPLLAALELLVLAAGAAGLAGATVYGWVWALPVWTRLDFFGHATQVYCTVGGVALLCAAPWAAGAAARAERRLAPALLGPGRAQRLQQRVERLAESRTDLIEAVDAERRRIERDLHDGTQQRLVSLAVNLGLAVATLEDLPDEARQVIEEAHREAKETIAELNDLVRGLHPAVLEDRGLDAALSGLAARVPLPVRLRVDIEGRVAPTVESVAYFVVSEALTNVTKHARATRAEVTVGQIGKVLRVNVTDDGLGGADATAGTGLSGLAKRVGSVDGTFRVSSPVGGPTTVAAELPCGQ
ncbi:sensor histidine kinase [Streptomyces sp. UNOC14_S4]|uniref:sensor histidine kinase n=1 Tax=Streptomyces sp. UNOC14_S4 TaxID=2872340 RepID=UPI001E32A504|nr:sensor histidine kinase [Streptomyces sp. UNOC14_S4]MCC3767400.1 sensor histidine kinase [Streptomyces sp. UNOC14_S4]